MMRRLFLLALAFAAVPALATVDLAIGTSNPSTATDPGFTIPLEFGVTNLGNEGVVGTVVVQLPAGYSLNRVDAPEWVCAPRPNGDVGCTTQMLPQLVHRFTLWVTMPESLDGVRFRGTARVESPVADARPDNNTVSFAINVRKFIQVTTFADAGTGSLRAAIDRVNSECKLQDDCKVSFAVSAQTPIVPQTPLPPITGCGWIIEAGVPSPRPDDPIGDFLPRSVEISGAHVLSGNGLELRASCEADNTLRGVAINGFPENGILIAPSAAKAPLSIDACFIGTDVTGTVARPNRSRGISIETASGGVYVNRSVISGNARSGIAVWYGNGVVLGRCFVGGGVHGESLGNGASGVFINSGTLLAEDSTIVANHEFGIAVGGGGHVVLFNNFIDGNGGIGVDWGMDGPTASDPSGRMPPVPQLLSATYNPATGNTDVLGVVHLDDKGPYEVLLFVNGPNSAGYGGEDEVLVSGIGPGAAGTDAKFFVSLRGDLRGRVITAATWRFLFFDYGPIDTSEFSAGIRVQ